MCGIVGLIRKSKAGFTQGEVKVFKELLFANQLRGFDGAGMFFNTQDKKIVTFKQAKPASYLLCNESMDKEMVPLLLKEASFVIGHNRAATKGEKITENTHPFHEGKIALVHNGTLSHHRHLYDTEVDSRAICYAINEKGDEEIIKKINGSFALVWANQQENTLNLCRNSERPLHLLESGFFYLICSEPDLGKWIIKRNNYNLVSEKSLEPYTKYTINVEDPSKIHETKITKPTYNHTQSYSGYWGPLKREYLLGDWIRFKTSGAYLHKKGRFYLDGDINKYQKQGETSVIETDFPDEWNVKYYGKKNDVSQFANQQDIIGEIVQVIIDPKEKSNKYVVARIEKYDSKKTYLNTKLKALPAPVKAANDSFTDDICLICHSKLTHNEKLFNDGMCIQCFRQYGGYSAWD